MQNCRGEKTRTSDLHVPNVARCQLCYTPIDKRNVVFATTKVVVFPNFTKSLAKNFKELV